MRNMITLAISMLMALAGTTQAAIEALWSTDAALPGEKVVLVLQQQHSGNAVPTKMRQVTPGKIKPYIFDADRLLYLCSDG